MRISLVTPSYNQAQFIGRTIDSVLAQTGDFVLDYRVIDGGSTPIRLERSTSVCKVRHSANAWVMPLVSWHWERFSSRPWKRPTKAAALREMPVLTTGCVCNGSDSVWGRNARPCERPR